MKIKFINLVCFAVFYLVNPIVFADDANDADRTILKFNCIESVTTVSSCKAEAIAQLLAMGCRLKSTEVNTECARLNDEVMCQFHSSNCQKPFTQDKKTKCPDGYTKEGALEPIKCPSCDRHKYYAKEAATPAIFEGVYYCKR